MHHQHPTRPAEDPAWVRERRRDLRLLLDQRELDTETAEEMRREIRALWSQDKARSSGR